MEVPLSLEERKPVTFSYEPSVLPVTLTLNEQLAPAAREAPVSEMVRVAVVVTRVPVPLHTEGVVALETDNPAGSTSLKAIPDCATFPLAVLLMVNVNEVDVPLTIGLVVKDLLRVGAGDGIRHPVRITLSIAKRELLFCAPVAEILKNVAPALVLNVDVPSDAPNVADPFEVNAEPSELEETVTAAPAFQLALVCI